MASGCRANTVVVYHYFAYWEVSLLRFSVFRENSFTWRKSFWQLFVHGWQGNASAPLAIRRETMAMATSCAHSFVMIKSDSTLLQWTCNICHSGPSWFIFECQYCKLHCCRTCCDHAWSIGHTKGKGCFKEFRVPATGPLAMKNCRLVLQDRLTNGYPNPNLTTNGDCCICKSLTALPPVITNGSHRLYWSFLSVQQPPSHRSRESN